MESINYRETFNLMEVIMKLRIFLALGLMLSTGLLAATTMYGSFKIVTTPRGADVNLYEIDLYLCATPSPVYPVFMDEYMELREGIPGRAINVIITKKGYVPIRRELFVPFLYTDQQIALDYPTEFHFHLTRDRMNAHVKTCVYYTCCYPRPRPVVYYVPYHVWYPPLIVAHYTYPIPPRPPHPPGGGYDPPLPPPPGGGYSGGHGSHGGGPGGGHGGGPDGGVNPPGGGSGGGNGSYPPGSGGFPPGGGTGGNNPPTEPEENISKPPNHYVIGTGNDLGTSSSGGSVNKPPKSTGNSDSRSQRTIIVRKEKPSANVPENVSRPSGNPGGQSTQREKSYSNSSSQNKTPARTEKETEIETQPRSSLLRKILKLGK